MGRQNKKTEKKVDTKQPQSGKVEKANKDDKKGPTGKVAEKVAKATGKQVKDVQVSQSVSKKDTKKETKTQPTKKQGKKEEKKKAPTPSSSSASSGSSEEQKVTAMEQSGSSSSGSESEAAAPAKKQKTEGSSENDGKVFVGNLSFQITEDDVKKFFADCGRTVKIVKNYAKAEAFAGEANTSVFLNNLPYDVTEELLNELYTDCGEIVSIRFPSKTGMAFVEFSSVDEAKKALAKSFDLSIKGRTVRAEFAKPSNRTNQDRPPRQQGGQRQGGRSNFSSPKPDGACTFFLGGLPDGVEEKDVHNVFPGCNIANIRWVETGGVFKGVGFVEFADTKQADKAFEIANKGVQIGRRFLRVDWAEPRKPRN